MRIINALAVLIAMSMMSIGCGNSEQAEETTRPLIGTKKTVKAEEPVDPMENKGVGPISQVDLSAEIDQEMALEGEEIFTNMCTACHKPLKKHIGPAPVDILDRRSPEWVMNMILNPDEMVKVDPIAKKLLMEFNGSPMANQNLTEDQARSVLEYFRTLNSEL